MRCLYIILMVIAAAVLQYWVISPTMSPLYRRHLGHMMKYSHEVIQSHCASIIGSSAMDAISVFRETRSPVKSTDEAPSFQKDAWSAQRGKKHRPVVYLGDICASTDEVLLKTHNIAYIVNLCDKCPDRFPSRLIYRSLPAPSDEYGLGQVAANMIYHELDTIIDFIDQALQRGDGSVLIHSARGANRAFLVAAAYLMKTHGWSIDDACAHIMALRPAVQPSDEVVRALTRYAERISDHSTSD